MNKAKAAIMDKFREEFGDGVDTAEWRLGWEWEDVETFLSQSLDDYAAQVKMSMLLDLEEIDKNKGKDDLIVAIKLTRYIKEQRQRLKALKGTDVWQ